MTPQEAYAWLRKRLASLGDAAAREAMLLLEDTLAREKVSRYSTLPLPGEAVVRLDGQAARRLQGEPLQYILGEWEFYSLPFEVGPGVLIPRPDTECLVEQALEYLKGRPPQRIIDLCSGSGAVAVAIAHHAPQCSVTALEKEPEAFGYLERNIRRNHAGNVRAVCADLLDGPRGLGPFDLIVSNPPYIRSKVIDTLEEPVKREPRTALDGGADGLDFYRAILSLWLPALRQGAAAMVEIGYDQAGEVFALFAPHFAHCACIQDYSGLDRVIVATGHR